MDGNLLSAVIDGAGGPLYSAYPRLMRTGGIIANYGQNQGVGFSMTHVLKNIDVKGSTMGSRKEFKDMVKFVDAHKIKPVVFKAWKGLTSESVDSAIDVMRLVCYALDNIIRILMYFIHSNGQQFGKLVIEIEPQVTGSPKL